jgi:beta-lactamase regulating signal transducer with metallopeptidase domain
MIAFGICLLKVSVCLAVFYALYATVFRRTTFFRFNRCYLLLSLLASFIIPLVPLNLFASKYDLIDLPALNSSFIEMENGPLLLPRQVSDSVISFSYAQITFCIYLIVVFLLLIRFVVTIFRLMRLKRYAQRHQADDRMIVRTALSRPFSFLRWIFIPRRQKVDPLIVEHERAHVIQHHWVDLFLLEVVIILLWFNPLMLLYRRAIQLQHEYLADEHIVEQGVSLEYYLNCLLLHTQQASVPFLTNSFYSQSIQQRIMMMTKDKTPQRFSAMYLLLIPVACLMLFAFSNKPATLVDTTRDEVVMIADDDHTPSLSPVAGTKAKISSSYGERMHPATHKKQMHLGVDFVLPQGENVMATADGEVVQSLKDDYRGINVIIRHDEIYTTSYSHLKDTTVKVGDKVKKGHVLGHVGSTGLSSTGPHLHYEVIQHGKNVDPEDYLPK